MTVRLTDHFGNRYVIEDARFVDSALFGRCIRGHYERGLGDFRLDTARSWEVVSGQLEIAA